MKIYDSFVENAERLSKSKELLQMVATEYVFKALPQPVILQLLKKQPDLPLPVFNEEVLKIEEVLVQTIKIIALMESSTTWDEFKKLNRKRKKVISPPEEETQSTGFDKILKGIMQVPKPKDKKPD